MTAISVVMGVYNGGPTLAATLDSILVQTEREFECIVVDDGSTDATPETLADYAARDPRLRVLRQDNAGLTRALIAGCAAAHGALIVRHDAGDLSHPRRFELQKAVFELHADLVFASCWTQYVGPELEPLWISRGSGLVGQPMEILDPARQHGVSEGPTHHGSVMFRRGAYEAAGGYRAAFRFGQDWDLWYRLAVLGRYLNVGEVLYTARITPESVSSDNRPAQQAMAELSYAALLARSRGQSDAAILARATAIPNTPNRGSARRAKGLYFIGEALRRNHDRRARNYLRKSIEAWPFSIRAWVRYLQSLVL